MTRASATLIAFATCLLLPTTSIASPLGIDVVSAQYTTDLYVFYNSWDIPSTQTTVTQTITGPSPVSSAIDISDVMYARATAATFSTSAATSAFGDRVGLLNGYGSSRASATSVVQFSPVEDATGAVSINFLGNSYFYWTDGLVNLFDVTAGQMMWDFYWNEGTVGNVPWNSTGCALCDAGDVTLIEEQPFFASHLYRLTIYTDSAGNTDDESAAIRLSGLQAVPEPSSLLLFAPASLVLGAVKRRRDRVGRRT